MLTSYTLSVSISTTKYCYLLSLLYSSIARWIFALTSSGSLVLYLASDLRSRDVIASTCIAFPIGFLIDVFDMNVRTGFTTTLGATYPIRLELGFSMQTV